MKQEASLHFHVPRETSLRLTDFVDVLLRWNARINLVSRADEPSIAERHLGDALQLMPLLPEDVRRAIDLGSGGGFPGLVLAIATGIHFDLVEADRRKATFLREAARITAAPVTVHCDRAETVTLNPAKLITARAFAPLPKLLEMAHRLLAPDAVLVLPKGKNAAQELTQARARWKMRVEEFPSKTDPDATILRLSEVTRG